MELINGRYEGRLADGRLLCVLPDVFEANRGLFPDSELYNPEEWLSSADGENCWTENLEYRSAWYALQTSIDGWRKLLESE